MDITGVQPTQSMQQATHRYRRGDGGMKEIMQSLSPQERRTLKEQMSSLSQSDREAAIKEMKSLDPAREDYTTQLFSILEQYTSTTPSTPQEGSTISFYA